MGKGRSAWEDGRRAWARLTFWQRDAPIGGRPRDGDSALKALTDIGRIRQLLDRAELVAVRTARAHGKSWAEIATMLGVTRQSAWEKWRDLDAAPAPEPAAGRPVGSEVGDDATGQGVAGGVGEVVGPGVGEVVDRALAGPAEGRAVTVPDLIGLPWGEARQMLADAGLLPVASQSGHGPLPPLGESGWVVVDQTPRGGARRTPGSWVTVWLERGGGAGVREPRRPTPRLRSARGERDEESQEAVG